MHVMLSLVCVEVFLLAIISGCRSSVVTNAPFTSRKSPAETISRYAIVHPIVSSAGQSYQGHPLELNVIVQVDRTTGFEIQLALNHKLLAPEFLTTHYDDDGEMVHGTHQNCFYQGKVIGHPKWIAEFSTCSGLRGSFGDLQDSSHSYYHLEPLGDSNSFDQPHAVYMDSEHKTSKHGTCGTTHDPSTSNMDTEQLFHKLDVSSKRLKRQNSNGLRVVEWLVVNDFVKYNVIYENNRTATELRSIEIANTIDMLYTPLGIRVVLVHMITITSAANQFNEPSESGALLNAFRSYHRTLPTTIQHDSAMLMTGINLDGSTIGIAFTGTMCGGSNSVGVTQDLGGQLASVSATAAHEMGHIFNMLHDDDNGRVCNCGTDNPRCIMRSSISFPPPTAWSDCSTSDLNGGYSTRNTGVCLDNDPSAIIGTATCGNGIKEPGEVCDCGPAQTCNDPCCNATSCELRSTAQCAGGACCQDCRFRAYGTICRPDSNECGLSEYCTGDNSECPSNVFRQDGQPCDNKTAYCFGGQCISHDLQCKLYYGQNSVASQPICYTSKNIVGGIQGHCGTRNDAFIPCAQANALCGSIQCNGGDFNQSSITFRSTLRLITTFAGQEPCSTFTTEATADEVSPGLVLDGTRCGNEMLCRNSQCVPVGSLSVLPCPVGSNAAVCSANGACNNLNQCFCNVGFTGSSCSDTTTGPDGSPGTGSPVGLAVGLTFLFLVLIGGAVAVVILVVFVILRKSNTHKSTSVTKPRYNPGSSSAKVVSSRNINGSKDDLLSGMESQSPQSHHRRPPPTAPGYKPPTFNSRPPVPPTVVIVNNNYVTNTNNVHKPPPPRPPPNRPPPSYNPGVEPTRPSAPPKPPVTNNLKPSPKPRTAHPPPTVNKPPITPKPTAPPKPATTPKPAKLQKQWPPPPPNNSSSAPPQPPKKPMAPPRR